MAGYCDNFSMIDGDSSNFSMNDGGDKFVAFPGLKGEDGTTFYPHVSAEGVLSWTNDGGKPNPDPVNIKGTDGTSAYQAAVEAGFSGTEAEFNEYLSGIGDLTEAISGKQDAPADDGTAGQVLGLDANLAPAWMTPPSGGTTDYNELSNRPKINGVTLSGNKTSADLGISSPTVYHFFYNNGYLSCSEISPVNFVRMSPETNNFQVVCYSDVYSFPNIVTYTSWAFGGIVFGDDYYQIQFFVSYLTEDASVRTAVMYVIYNPSTDSGKSWNQLFVNIVESH